MTALPGVAVIGCGRWGIKLVRVFSRLGALRAVNDIDATAADSAAAGHGVGAVEAQAILADPRVAAIVVATPAGAHFPMAERALLAGKHVFVEKPLALTVHEAERLCQLADSRRLVLMVGHLLRYHPAFEQLEHAVAEGELGRLRYLYSQRLNLGRMRQEEDSLWSFAPHDVSMILALLSGEEPERVWAIGGHYLTEGIADVTTTHLSFSGGVRAHVFVSWLHPFKEQKLVVVGERAMAVFDDGQPWESKLRLFRHVIHRKGGAPEPRPAQPETVPLEPREPLDVEARHFLRCVRTGTTPLTDGREGMRVLRVIQRAAISMGERWHRVFVHPSAYVDEPVTIGAGTKIWHFSHVLAGSTIGRECVIGQNVMIGPNVTVGDRCKIQNNVSLYEGVTLEDEVFCGPSCVFTNVATPRAGADRRGEFLPTRVGRGATIGANATIVCGHSVGAWSFVAAGAVVTSDVPPHALVAGVPARRIGWVSHAGERLGPDLVCPRSGRRYVLRGPDDLAEVVDG